MSQGRSEGAEPAPHVAARALKRLLVWRHDLAGWTATQLSPPPRKCVIIAVPHTSNWDFPNVLGTFQSLGIRPRFIAKKSLFDGALGGFMRAMGGVPVDRGASGGMVGQMVQEFAQREDFQLVIAPEGTRRAVPELKRGFYHIADGAGVPIVCGFMDYSRKVAGLGPTVHPTGDYDADMKTAWEFYRGVTPKFPGRFALSAVRRV